MFRVDSFLGPYRRYIHSLDEKDVGKRVINVLAIELPNGEYDLSEYCKISVVTMRNTLKEKNPKLNLKYIEGWVCIDDIKDSDTFIKQLHIFRAEYINKDHKFGFCPDFVSLYPGNYSLGMKKLLGS